jgi:hypothetical protein
VVSHVTTLRQQASKVKDSEKSRLRAPNDVDVFLIMADSFGCVRVNGRNAPAVRSPRRRGAFWSQRLLAPTAGALEGEQAAVEYWQVKRDGQGRGVVEIDLGAS